jgi:MFS family permease
METLPMKKDYHNLIYLFPALADIIVGAIMFTVTVRLASSGAAPLEVTGIIAIWAFCYMFITRMVGNLVTPSNSVVFLVTSSLGLSALSGLFLLFSGLLTQYYLIILLAMCTASFFPSFQVFMKQVGHNKNSLTRSSGLYIFSWSSGFATGPFIAGMLWKFTGWQGCYYINIVIGIITALGIWLLKHHAENDQSPEAEATGSEKKKHHSYEGMPDLAWLGWICSGFGCFTFSLLRYLFPSLAHDYTIPEYEQGIILSITCFVQALTGLFMCRSKDWMYRPLPVALFGIAGILGAFFFAISRTAWGFYPASALFGVYTGSLFFYFTFHSLAHPKFSTKYISINESIVGLTTILGPLLGGIAALYVPIPIVYLGATAILLVVIIFQLNVHLRLRSTSLK